MLKRVFSLAAAMSIMLLTLLAITGTASAASSPHYKAIAWAPSTNTIPYVGVGQTAQGAESAALSICHEFERGTPPYYGRDCRGAVWVYNGWLAFYSEDAPSPNGATGWAWASGQQRAIQLALQACINHHGTACKLRTDQGTQPFMSGVSTRGGFWGAPRVPEITSVGTYTKGALVYFDIHYADPGNDAEGFGFVGVNGSGWAEETHPFSSPSYGIVGPDSIAYPFNEACGTAQQYGSYVQAWIYDIYGDQSTPVVIHLVCTG